jgi:ribose-phosphate pyrophosphokinase
MRNNDFFLVSPDAGSNKKIFDLAKLMGYVGEIIRCDKIRDISTGKIIETVVYKDDLFGKDVIIIDDIIDGGNTFVEIAKCLKQKNVGKLYLIVTHGIFSAGFETLSEYFDRIYTTNSVKDIQDGTIVNTFSKHKTIHELVKQLNVFK